MDDINNLKITTSCLSNNDVKKPQTANKTEKAKASVIAQALSANNKDNQNNPDLFANCLVIGITYALGTDPKPLIEQLQKEFGHYGYDAVHWLNISDFLADEPKQNGPKPWWQTLSCLQADAIKQAIAKDTDTDTELEKETFEMRAGTQLRTAYGPSILAELALLELVQSQEIRLCDHLVTRRLIILSSFKQPDEIRLLKTVLGDHFFFIALYEDSKAREIAYKHKPDKKYSTQQIKQFIITDRDQKDVENGQKLADTFALADYIMAASNDSDSLKDQVQRCLKLLFGYPFTTPTPDEHGQYLAYCAALKSSDLARQVGAVIIKDHNLLSMGANEPPQFGGGTYWPLTQHGLISEHPKGRDFMRCDDSNKSYQDEIAKAVLKALEGKNPGCQHDKDDLKKCIGNAIKPWITEYGRSVHAEMDAICSAARMGISLVGATLYTTTFPCHNCARHIITAGIKRVVFIEPYPKSQALKLHDDALSLQQHDPQANKVSLEHFTGVCPPAFTHYFAVNSPTLGRALERKTVFNQLKIQGEERLQRESLLKTLNQLPNNEQQPSASTATEDSHTENNQNEDYLDPPGKNSHCASRYFYQLWQGQAKNPKPSLRFREFKDVLAARLQQFLNAGKG